jgi:hypothetical protein
MAKTFLTAPSSRRRRKQLALASPAEADANPLGPEEAHRLEEELLERLAQGARLCQELESKLRQDPAPELETILKLHRVLVLRLSAEAQARPEMLSLVSALMKPLLDWARIEEKRKDRELAEQKYREQAAQRKEKEQSGPGEALTPATLEKIEHELNLF